MELLEGLDSLRCRREAQRVSQGDDCLDDGVILGVLPKPCHEVAINLEDAHREASKVHE